MPCETGLEMLLPFQEKPSPEETYRLRTALEILGGHLEDLRERLEDFQHTVKGMEYVVEAENAGLARLARLLYDDE